MPVLGGANATSRLAKQVVVGLVGLVDQQTRLGCVMWERSARQRTRLRSGREIPGDLFPIWLVRGVLRCGWTKRVLWMSRR